MARVARDYLKETRSSSKLEQFHCSIPRQSESRAACCYYGDEASPRYEFVAQYSKFSLVFP